MVRKIRERHWLGSTDRGCHADLSENSGKAKIAIAEIAYCRAMYKDSLKILNRKFGQPQAVVTADLDKLVNIPPVKMHNS